MAELFISSPQNLEFLLSEELKELGLDAKVTHHGVLVPYSMEAIYQINYLSRIATRVLLPLKEFHCATKQDLYYEIKMLPWRRWIHSGKSFAIDANLSDHAELNNSLYAAQVTKDAICDHFTEKALLRPSVNVKTPDIQLNLFIRKNQAMIYFDTSGQPLYKRGWRKAKVEAPLQESTAAAILRFAGYRKEQILCDPFCGSGTILIEAAMMATQTPAGFYRKAWGFMHLPEFSKEDWMRIKESADGKILPLQRRKIFGSDKNPEAFDATYANLATSGFQEIIEVMLRDVEYFRHPVTPNFIVTNPPYGLRLEASVETFQSFAKFFVERCAPTTKAYLLSPEATPIQSMNLLLEKKLEISNGGIETILFECSKKIREQV